MPAQNKDNTIQDDTREAKVQKLIYALSNQANLTQSAIADALEVSQATISLLKNLRAKATDDHLNKLTTLAQQFGLSLETIDTSSEKPLDSDDNGADSYSVWLAGVIQQLDISLLEFSKRANLSYLGLKRIVDGVTANPQSGTRKSIDDAIKIIQGEKKKKAEEFAPEPVQKEEQLFIGLTFTEVEINQAPDKKGVYVIHDRRGYPTYVGKGNIRSRLRRHREHKAFLDERVACTFSYVLLQQKDDPESIKKADAEARRLETIITKFAGNTVLLNKQLIEDLSID